MFKGRSTPGTHGHNRIDPECRESRDIPGFQGVDIFRLAGPDERGTATDLVPWNNDPDAVSPEHLNRIESLSGGDAGYTDTRRRTRPSFLQGHRAP